MNRTVHVLVAIELMAYGLHAGGQAFLRQALENTITLVAFGCRSKRAGALAWLLLNRVIGQVLTRSATDKKLAFRSSAKPTEDFKMEMQDRQAIAVKNSVGQEVRPARALIGWMDSTEAQLVLAGRVTELAHNQSNSDRARAARESVACRPESMDSPPDPDEPGSDFGDGLASFLTQPDCQQFLTDGWSVRIADLKNVVALQPTVFWDHAQDRTHSAVIGDYATLARITLPAPSEPEALPIQFDPARNTWMAISRNPNLCILGNFSGPVDLGPGRRATGYGFVVVVKPSFVRVARFRDRLLLLDGYHRALGLLSRGICRVPVLFREFERFEPLGLGPGMLPESSFLGGRPPYLADFLDDSVSAEVNLPKTQKMIAIQAFEYRPIG